MRRTLAPLLALVLLASVLAPAPSGAATRPGRVGVVEAPTPGAGWFWLALRLEFPAWAGVWEKIGLSADPNGQPLPGAPASNPQAEIGLSADPDGQ